MTKMQMIEKNRRLRARVEEFIQEMLKVNPNTGTTNVVIGCSTVVDRLQQLLKADKENT